MTNFMSEIIKCCGLDFATAMGGIRYTVFETNVAYIEGHRGLVAIDETCAILRSKVGVMKIFGERLVVTNLAKGMLVIKGDNLRIEYKKN